MTKTAIKGKVPDIQVEQEKLSKGINKLSGCNHVLVEVWGKVNSI